MIKDEDVKDELYLSVKMLRAQPMTRLAYNQERGWHLPEGENGADAGYMVKPVRQFPLENYVTWTPKEIFERDSQQIDNLSFGHALAACLDGAKIARQSWNGANQYIIFVAPTAYEVGMSVCGNPEALQPFLALVNSQGTFQPGWLPSMGDLLKTDWYVRV